MEAFRYGLNNVFVPQLTEEESNTNDEKVSLSTLQQDAENTATNNGGDSNIDDDDEDPSRVARRQKWQDIKSNEDEKLKGGNNTHDSDSSMLLVCPSTANLNNADNDISMSSEYNNINAEEAEEEATNIDTDIECKNVWNKVDTGFINPPTTSSFTNDYYNANPNEAEDEDDDEDLYGDGSGGDDLVSFKQKKRVWCLVVWGASIAARQCAPAPMVPAERPHTVSCRLVATHELATPHRRAAAHV